MEIALLVLGLMLGAAVGGSLAWSHGRSRLAAVEAERTVLREQLTKSDSATARAQDLAVTVAPLREALGKVEAHLRELEGARVGAYAALTEQVGFVRSVSESLRAETSNLVQALRAPQARGRWGEMQLRRVVEMAGMVEHCDFTEQATATHDGATIRPDLVVRLAGGKQVVVDAKVSLAAYLEAAESRDPDVVEARLQAHARHLREHVKGLSAKEYWRAFQPTPEFVVLFVPGDAFLAPALERDPSLLEDAMALRILIATPTTLMAMLRTVAYSWQQEALTHHARTVFELGRELYRRLGTLGGHVDKMGRTLGRAVDDYNRLIGSLESTVLVQARKMAALDVVDLELPELRGVEAAPRPIGAPELLQSTSVVSTEPETRGLPSVEALVDAVRQDELRQDEEVRPLREAT